jgi:hypothetical protein
MGVAVYGGVAWATPPSGVTSPPWSPVIDHDLHMVRNNSTTTVADVYVVSFVPAGFARRIDAPNPNPSICPN